MYFFALCKGKNYYFCSPMKDEKRTFISKMSFPFLFVLLVLLGGCALVSRMMQGNDDRAACDDTMVQELPSIDYCEGLFVTQWDSIKHNHPDPSQYCRHHTVADSIIDYAMRFMRVPYVPAGRGPDKFDCSGFTHYVFSRFGYDLSYYAPDQLHQGWCVINKPEDLKRGDLVFYGGRRNKRQIGHVAIVVNNDVVNHSFTFIHATVHQGVIVSTSTEAYYAQRYITACRVLPDNLYEN